MIQLLATVLGLAILGFAMLIGLGSNTPDALERQRVETEGVVGYDAIRSASDAYRVANRGAILPDDAAADLFPYLPVAPRLPEGLSWSIHGGAKPFACASGRASATPVQDGLTRLAARFGGTVGPACGTAGTASGAAIAVTLPLAPD